MPEGVEHYGEHMKESIETVMRSDLRCRKALSTDGAAGLGPVLPWLRDQTSDAGRR
jgi:hypothetical protein